jgi:hypothetical protein
MPMAASAMQVLGTAASQPESPPWGQAPALIEKQPAFRPGRCREPEPGGLPVEIARLITAVGQHIQ